ncbi:MAG: large repetitive protein, partial [Gaiellales bacterium]|nr:large repetitive protein [Gaiellales bacterium]
MSNAVLPPRRIVAVLLLACGFAAAAAVPAQARYDAPRTSLSVTLTQKPTANSHNTNAVFRWRRVGVARQTTCRLDTRAFGKCKGSSVTYRHLAEGMHRFSLKVRGRTATRTISSTWRVDVTTPDVPTSVTGGSVAWGTASRTLTAAGSTDSGSGLRGYQFRLSKDGGLTWSPPRLNNPIVVNTAGESVVQFRAMDKALNTSAWTLVPPTGEATVRIDRTVPSAPLPHGPTAGWQNVASLDVTADGSVDAGGSGLGGYSYRVSTDGGLSWLPEADGGALTVGTEGLTLVKFRAHDGAGNVSPWTQATVRIDRTAPSDPVVVGGSPAWLGIASVLVSASGSTDAPGSGVAGYERQTSTDGGATWSPSALGGALTVAAEGETLVRFRAVDVSGLPSGWVQTTVRLDRTAPAVPAVSGGGSGWQNVASIGLSAAGSTDTGGSGLSGYQFATSADGGATWSAPQSGASSTVSAEGQTLVRFRAFDNVGNGSPWATGTARIDRSVPTDPVVSGGSASWLSVASVDVSAAGSTDAGSGIALYLLSSSTNGGATWSPPAVGATLNVPAQGQTLVRFRAVDALGLTSNWVQATVRIDRTAPTSPVVSGGSLSWLGAAASTVTGAGSTDSGGSGL